MQTELQNDGGVVTARITGTIDTGTSAQLESELRDIVADRLILDFAEVEYITSAGLRVLLIQRKRFPDDKMEVINVSPAVNEVFKITGFDRILNIQAPGRDMARHLQQSLKEFLAEKAADEPDRTAVSYGGESYTWADLEHFSQIIANDLKKQGVGRGTHVGLMGMNSANWILTFFAIQKLNAIALLVNFNLKASEIQSLSKIGDITHLCYGELPDVGGAKRSLCRL